MTNQAVQQAFDLTFTLQWRHNERDGVSHHQPHHCLLIRLFKAHLKENIKAPRHWPSWGEFIGDRWIPRTKRPVTRKCFHLMTLSWFVMPWPFCNVPFTIPLSPTQLHICLKSGIRACSLSGQTFYRNVSWCLETVPIALKLDRHIGSSTAEMPVKFQSDMIIITSNSTASRLHEILW